MSIFIKKNIYNLVGTVLLLGLLSSVVAQNIEVEAKVSRAEIFIGDRFEYKITVRYDDTGSVDLPGLVGNLGSFEVSDFSTSEVTKGKNQRKQIWTLNLSTFISGDFVLPPQLIEYSLNAEQEPLRFFTDPVQIKVLTRNSGEETDILDVESPLADPSVPKYMWYIIGAAALIFIIALIVYLIKKNKSKIKPRLPPYEEAVLAFKSLQQENYLAENKQREHFFKLTEIIKTYLDRRFDAIDALDATSSQLLDRVKNHAVLNDEQFKDLELFCQKGDLVKFASINLELDECEKINQAMEQLVDQTKPLAEKEKKKNSSDEKKGGES